MTLAATYYLGLGGLVTIGFGVAYLSRSRLMARLVGISLTSASARADYRSIYGGAQICLGLFFCLAARIPTWRIPGLAAFSLFAFGFGATRLGSLALDRVGRRDVQWVVGALEVIAAAVGAVILLKS
jgi:hypothetical protein